MADNPPDPERTRPPVRIRTRPAANADEAPEPRIAAVPSGTARRSPNSGSFVPGQSGNPAGRPKGAKGVKPMVRKVLTAKTKVRDASGIHKVTIFQALVHKELELAINGDWRARKTIMELGRWALPEEAPETAASSPRETTATDEATLAWFEDEVKSRYQERP